MRAGNAWHRVKFYAKVTTRDDYGASVDSWPAVTISTRGEIRYTGGGRSLSESEKFYSKSIDLIIRYRNDITETMKVLIDEGTDFYLIGYKEIQGRNESLRLTLEKENA